MRPRGSTQLLRASVAERHMTRKQRCESQTETGRSLFLVCLRRRLGGDGSHCHTAKDRGRIRTATAVHDYDRNMFSNRSCLWTLLKCLVICVTLWSSLSSEVFAKSSQRPNIVLILTDDLDIAIGGLVSNSCF